MAFYVVDWDWSGARQERIDFSDAATGQLLDSRVVAGFQNGQYWVRNVKGHVKVTITNTGTPTRRS